MLAAPSGCCYPDADDGVEIRRLLQRQRSAAIERFNGQFKAIFDVNGPVPTCGPTAARRFVLGVVRADHLALLLRFEAGQDRRVGLWSVLQAA